MSLVKGFTDIITPINIVPNSDFSRGDFGTLTAGSYPIAEDWDLVVQSGCTLSNVVVKRETSAFTITGHTDVVPETATSTFIFRNRTNATVWGGTFTFLHEVFEQTNIDTTDGAFNQGSTIIHYSAYNGNRHCTIKSYANVSGGKSAGLYAIVRQGVDFKLKAGAFAVYKNSAFINPPFFKALDSDTHNNFMLQNFSNMYNKPIYTITLDGGTSYHWYRLCKIYTVSNYNTASGIHYIELLLYKNWSVGGGAIYFVKAAKVLPVAINNTARGYYLEAKMIKASTGNNDQFTKFRLAYDSNNELYIEGYFNRYNTSYKNVAAVYIKDSFYNQNYFTNLVPPARDGNSDTLLGSEVTPTDLRVAY